MKDFNTIIQLSNSYQKHKNILNDYDRGVYRKNYKDLKPASLIVKVTEETTKSLPERDQFIIHNEVILGKRGKWYMGYMSQATYYRHRKEAYKNFIERLKR